MLKKMDEDDRKKRKGGSSNACGSGEICTGKEGATAEGKIDTLQG